MEETSRRIGGATVGNKKKPAKKAPAQGQPGQGKQPAKPSKKGKKK